MVKRVLTYVESARASRLAFSSKPGIIDLVRSFPSWWGSFEARDEITDKALPWLTFPAVFFLKDRSQAHWRVFEFGSGASSVFFALRCREIFSIEHDAVWAERMKTTIGRLGISNVQLRYVPADVVTHSGYGSQFPGWESRTFEAYVTSIDAHADGSLDLVVVDGRAREACLLQAIGKVRPGGMLILDNSERSRYQAAMGRVPGDWRRIEFPGPCARTEFFTKTTVWIAPTA